MPAQGPLAIWSGPVFHADTETFLIQPGLQAPPMVCLQFAYDEAAPDLVHVRDPACYRVLREALEGPALWNFQNTAFDACVIMAQYPDLIRPMFDKYDRDEVTCTIVRQKLFDIARGRFKQRSKSGYALDRIAAYHGLNLGLDKNDPWRLRYGELISAPVDTWPREARDYALKDVYAQRLLFQAQEAYAESRAIPLLDQFRQARAALWIRLMECRGFMVDPLRTEAYLHEIAETLAEDRERLQGLGWVRRDGSRDTKAAMVHMAQLCIDTEEPIPLTDTGLERLCEALALPADTDPTPEQTWQWWEAVKGDPKAIAGVKLDEDSVIQFGDEDLEAYQRYSTSTTQMARGQRLYLAARAGVPIQPTFGTLVDTGRMSCSQGDRKKPGQAPSAYGFQTQNPAKDKKVKRKCPPGWLPGKEVHTDPITGQTVAAWVLRRGPRELFVAREGFDLCSTDYGSMELCGVAWVCLRTVGHSRLAEVLNAGRDPHTELGAVLAGISSDEAYARRRGDRGSELQKEFNDRYRQLAKIANFGFWGGMGAKKLRLQARKQYGVVMTLDEAKALHKAFKQAWPEFEAFCKWGKSKLSGERGQERGDFTQFIVGRRRGQLWFSALLNTTFQGLCADIKKAAVWRIAYEMYTGVCYDARDMASPLAGCFLVNDVHDEPITELRSEASAVAALRIAAIQVQTASEMCPEIVWTCEPALMGRWYKAAEAVYNEVGDLVRWAPKEKAA